MLEIDVGQDLVGGILGEYDDTDTTDGDGAPFGGYDIEPTADRPPCYNAALQAREDPPDHVANWEIIGYATMLGAAFGFDNSEIVEDFQAHPTPTYGFDPNREPNEVSRLAPQVRSGDRHPPNARTLAEVGVLPDAGACDCPLHRSAPGFTPSGDDGQHTVEPCAPPAYDPAPFDADQHRDHLRCDRYERARGANRPVVWADAAGSGKTTNAGLGAADRDDRHSILFDKHEKAREYITDSVTPDAETYFHLKGAEQAREPHCMDADHRDGDGGADCPQHGDTRNCPRMCPVYDLPADHDDRERFTEVMRETSPVMAHILLEPHDGNGDGNGRGRTVRISTSSTPFDRPTASSASTSTSGCRPLPTAGKRSSTKNRDP